MREQIDEAQSFKRTREEEKQRVKEERLEQQRLEAVRLEEMYGSRSSSTIDQSATFVREGEGAHSVADVQDQPDGEGNEVAIAASPLPHKAAPRRGLAISDLLVPSLATEYSVGEKEIELRVRQQKLMRKKECAEKKLRELVVQVVRTDLELERWSWRRC